LLRRSVIGGSDDAYYEAFQSRLKNGISSSIAT
jgi:hypothetical protein